MKASNRFEIYKFVKNYENKDGFWGPILIEVNKFYKGKCTPIDVICNVNKTQFAAPVDLENYSDRDDHN
jgi:hypothetical protein